jgi:hypothetical protein
MPIYFSCPLCFAELTAADSAAGQETVCPSCHQGIAVPLVSVAIPEPGDFAFDPGPGQPEAMTTPLSRPVQTGFGVGCGIALGFAAVNLVLFIIVLILFPGVRALFWMAGQPAP